MSRIFFFFLALIASSALFAQTQMANSDFEQWSSTGTGDAIPKYWHSYGDADCRLTGVYAWGCSMMKKNHSNRVAGHSGYGCEIYSKSLAGNLVNGVITTGQMRTASVDDKSSENYTYTDKNNSCGHNAAMAFTGCPDSVYFWCKFDMKKASNVAVAKFHLHENIAYRDVSSHKSSTAQKGKVGNAFCEFTDPNDHKWHRYKFKFTYYDEQNNVVKKSTRKPSYVLAAFSTNKITKGGSAGDKLVIDDIVMVYNKRLSYIEVDGNPLPGFHPDVHEYEYACLNTDGQLPIFTAATQSPNATVTVEQASAENGYTARFVVHHDDGEKTYSVRLANALESLTIK